ncbi:Wadjet anti-phage system protein JetD domain-containing protein [Caenispirillum bisanense]|uniref:Wadjet protein JetD C-terminal domain-containing protein n=1 Tax=Caenispirillum bisanense TaxID=414052 RepID=A0A286GWL1_9PROT|nr:Wadjet anti-phage system protein JetD domain-containing protein [Caenispirillum bisanense]SOD99444.1 hypothetical protein SAMN05421508_10915 [Caenispirillum bisanense]
MLARKEDVARVAAFFHRKRAGGATYVNAGTLHGQLVKATGIKSRAVLNDAMKQLKMDSVIDCEFGTTWPVSRVTITPPPEAVLGDAEQAWRETVLRMVADDADRTAYYLFYPKLSDWPVDRFDALIATIETIRRTKPADMLLPLASAVGPLASSKLLQNLPAPALHALGINMAALPRLPNYIMLAGPATPEAVVLVENPAAFERAMAATRDLPVVWVAAFGFALSAPEAGGQRLADGVENPWTCAPVVREGTPPPLEALLRHPALFHWGDLDKAGLQIFHRIRSQVPHIRLSALMQPMIDLLSQGGGHPYSDLSGKPMQLAWTGGEAIINRLLALCGDHAVDQEFLEPEDIRLLCRSALREERAAVR